MASSVKLKIYQYEPEAIYIDTIEANDFGDFLIVTFENIDHDGFDEFAHHLKETFPDKKILIMPAKMDIAFYGIREDDDNRLIDSQLQHEGSPEETP